MVGCDGRPVCQLVVSAGVARADKDVGRNAGQGLSSPGLGWERPLEKMELRADGGEEETCVYNCSRRVSTGGKEKVKIKKKKSCIASVPGSFKKKIKRGQSSWSKVR